MRHPLESELYKIEPWTFVREQKTYIGTLPLEKTETLRKWQGGGRDGIQFEISGYIDAHGQYRLTGKIKVVLQMVCQRCLEKMFIPVNCAFDYVLLSDQKLENRITDGSEAYVCAEDRLDLAWFIEEEILLAMPMIAKHDNCKLLHTDNSVLVESSQENVNPFAALKEMMEAKEKSHGSSTKS